MKRIEERNLYYINKWLSGKLFELSNNIVGQGSTVLAEVTSGVVWISNHFTFLSPSLWDDGSI